MGADSSVLVAALCGAAAGALLLLLLLRGRGRGRLRAQADEGRGRRERALEHMAEAAARFREQEGARVDTVQLKDRLSKDRDNTLQVDRTSDPLFPKIQAFFQKSLRATMKEQGRKHDRLGSKSPGIDADLILSLSLVELAKQLGDGSLSPDWVFYTYVDKALQVTKEINCVTDYLQESESQLQQVKRQEKKGLLYGVPVSIKDSINCQGHDSTLGLWKRLNQPAAEDSLVVQVLKRQGALPFVKTNVPQGLLTFDCNNLIFGQTLNPLDHTKTPGGSSGGEAALIGSGGSVLGIGTDLGGSLRIPAAFCGICTLKSTGGRLSKRGMVSCIPGQKSAVAGIGPMAKDVDSLALCMRALLCEDMFRLDPTVPPMPFNEEVFSSSRPLRIGYYSTDFYIVQGPSMRRAVLETKELLENAGHTLVPFKPCGTEYFISQLCLKTLFADEGATFLELFTGEPKEPSMKRFLWLFKVPRPLRLLLSWILKSIEPRLASILRTMRERSVKELWKLHCETEEYCREFTDKWSRLDLDVMLCPALGPAFQIGFPGKTSVSTSYSILYNYLDFPAGVVPVTTVTEEDEEELKNNKRYCNNLWDEAFVQAIQGAVGLPVAVQCVALPWQEELCLRFMKEVETLTQKKQRNL